MNVNVDFFLPPAAWHGARSHAVWPPPWPPSTDTPRPSWSSNRGGGTWSGHSTSQKPLSKTAPGPCGTSTSAPYRTTERDLSISGWTYRSAAKTPQRTGTPATTPTDSATNIASIFFFQRVGYYCPSILFLIKSCNRPPCILPALWCASEEQMVVRPNAAWPHRPI